VADPGRVAVWHAVPMTEPAARDTLRHIDLAKIGEGRYKATNRRGGVLPVGSGDDPDFTPVELLLAALAGCGAIDVDLITGRRAEATEFAVRAEGHKIRDEHGNRLVDLRVTFDVRFPDGEDGDRARASLPRALAQTHDRLCTVGRTIEVGCPIEYVEAEE
jgi:putative redox protein